MVGDSRDWPDWTRGTQARRDLEDVLRRALHAAVDTIEPAEDGLTRIMHRLTTPAVVRRATLLVTDCVDLARLITIRFEPAFTVATRLRWRHYAGYRRRDPQRAAWARSRPAVPWLRPALAVASAVMVVVIGALVLGHVREIVTKTSLNTDTGAGTATHAGPPSGGGRGPSPNVNLGQTGSAGSGTAPGRVGPNGHQHSCAAASCSSATPSASPTADPSQSPTPAPSKTKGPKKPHPSHSPKGKGSS